MLTSKASQKGFSNAQFKKLDGLFLRSAADKILNHRTVDCDFEKGLAIFCYYKSEYHPPLYKFVIRCEGPHMMMYELWREGKGRIAKSGLFERVFNKLKDEISCLK